MIQMAVKCHLVEVKWLIFPCALKKLSPEIYSDNYLYRRQ